MYVTIFVDLYVYIMMSVASPLPDVKQAIKGCRDSDVNMTSFFANLPNELRRDNM